MIELTRGNVLKADAQALVNTVNTVGFMGKGIALQFKKAFPANYEAYHRACKTGEVVQGRMHVFETGRMMNPKYIINFPTKRHWRGKSKIEDIEHGLNDLLKIVRQLGIKSIAIPPLGCGLGGLDWGQVRRLIEEKFREANDIRVLLYEPVGAPDHSDMPIGTSRPKWTSSRALVVLAMHRYSQLAYRLTLLEIQKLAYFLQEAGEPLRLQFKKGLYGPYAHNLNKVLERMEGHFTRGYGDTQKPDVEIELVKGIAEEAIEFLNSEQESVQRLDVVADIIEGFETPFGMELLSSVYWVTHEDDNPARDTETTIRQVHDWNERKRSLFSSAQIAAAWRRLEEKGWLDMGSKPHKF